MPSLDKQLEKIRNLRDRLGWLDMERQEAEEKFAQQFRAWRTASGIRLREAAIKLEISAAYLSDIELGKRSISPEMIIRLAKFLREH